jgi:thiol peroxidase
MKRLTVTCSIVLTALLLAGCQSAAPRQRTGLVTMRGNPLTLLGRPVSVGDPAPSFTAVANDLSTFDFAGRPQAVYIIASVPSIDTPVCSAETRRFNEEAGKLGPAIKVLTVSMDLPFAQKRWCGAEGITAVQTLSDFRDRAFGDTYGLRIKENGLLARAVLVVDRQGKIVYQQIVPELTQEPDYAAALAAARKAAGA